MKKFAIAALVIGLVSLVSGAVTADEKTNPAGTWKFKSNRDKERENTLKLELKDSNLTGTLSGGKYELKIDDGAFKDATVSFTVTRDSNGNNVMWKYSGKVDGDVIKGTVEVNRGGKEAKTEWVAMREKKTKD